MVSLSAYAGLGMSPAELAAFYRQHAGSCFSLARKIGGSVEKLTLIDMAQAWMALAAQAEKNESLFTIYETPEPRQRAVQQQPSKLQKE